MPDSALTRPSTGPAVQQLQITGGLLFLFIPLVLFLFVRRPEPAGWSLLAGIGLMIGHRLLARPYMAKARPAKCLWSNRGFGDLAPGQALPLRTAAGDLEARCHAEHAAAAGSFFSFLDRWRWPLRVGIFVPLLALLTTSAAATLGYAAPITTVTAAFQLVIGLTVNLLAFGYRFQQPTAQPTVPFPVHNFFLLGVRNLLWIFRLVGVWWIVVALRYFWAA